MYLLHAESMCPTGVRPKYRSLHLLFDYTFKFCIVEIKFTFSSLAVHEAYPYSVREGPLNIHGAVGVSQWHRKVPCLLQLHQEEEHD